MVTLRMRKITYENRDFEVKELMTIKSAAERLNMTIDAVISAVARGLFTELVDPHAVNPFKNRRFLLRSEVEEMAERRARAAALEGVE